MVHVEGIEKIPEKCLVEFKTKDVNSDFNKPYFVILKKPSKYNDIETHFEGSRCKYLFPTLPVINRDNTDKNLILYRGKENVTY